VRAALETLNSFGGGGTRFGTKKKVDPVALLLGAAVGWGGNPEYAAIYRGVHPKANDGRTVHRPDGARRTYRWILVDQHL
jgi:para-nitrobenzyl esterase